jgi:predicted RNase H-like HicB family nuclease
MEIDPQLVFTGVVIETDGCYIGYVEELPGANTQGRTIEEVTENLSEAIKLTLCANRMLAERDLTEKGQTGEIPPQKVTRKQIAVPAA